MTSFSPETPDRSRLSAQTLTTGEEPRDGKEPIRLQRG
jgi:hypothetical protein